jgi:hypothetical protein
VDFEVDLARAEFLQHFTMHMISETCLEVFEPFEADSHRTNHVSVDMEGK